MATTTNVSEHWKGEQFAGFKKMIGATRFYFFRDFGISTNSAKDRKKAEAVAAQFERYYFDELKPAGMDWTEQTKAAAKLAIRNRLATTAMIQAATGSTSPDGASSTIMLPTPAGAEAGAYASNANVGADG